MFVFFAAWPVPRKNGEWLAQPQVKRDGSLTSKSDSLCGLSACLPCLTGWLLFALAAKCCLHMFIHVATGCFIHQDGTYHSWIRKKKKEKKMHSLAATFEINEWKSLIKKRMLMFQQKKRLKIQVPRTCLRVTNDFDLLYCLRTIGTLHCQSFLASGGF